MYSRLVVSTHQTFMIFSRNCRHTRTRINTRTQTHAVVCLRFYDGTHVIVLSGRIVFYTRVFGAGPSRERFRETFHGRCGVGDTDRTAVEPSYRRNVVFNIN